MQALGDLNGVHVHGACSTECKQNRSMGRPLKRTPRDQGALKALGPRAHTNAQTQIGLGGNAVAPPFRPRSPRLILPAIAGRNIHIHEFSHTVKAHTEVRVDDTGTYKCSRQVCSRRRRRRRRRPGAAHRLRAQSERARRAAAARREKGRLYQSDSLQACTSAKAAPRPWPPAAARAHKRWRARGPQPRRARRGCSAARAPAPRTWRANGRLRRARPAHSRDIVARMAKLPRRQTAGARAQTRAAPPEFKTGPARARARWVTACGARLGCDPGLWLGGWPAPAAPRAGAKSK